MGICYKHRVAKFDTVFIEDLLNDSGEIKK